MDFFNTVLVVVCCALIIFFLLWFNSHLKFREIINKFPGQPGNFLLGNCYHLSSKPDVLFLQLRGLAKQFQNGYRQWFALLGIINLTKAEDFEVILSSRKHIEKSLIYNLFKSWLGDGLLISGGEKWHKRRRILTPAFHFNILCRFVPIFEKHSASLVKELQDECKNEKTNILPLIYNATLNIICETAMGINLDKDDEKSIEYRKAIHIAGRLFIKRSVDVKYFLDTIFFLTPSGREMKRNLKILHEFTESVIRERENNFKESDVENLDKDDNIYRKKRFAMLDLLISAKRKGEDIDDVGIREEVDTFMFEGHDTTSMALCYALLMLANHKDVQDKVRFEIDEIFQDSTRHASYNDLQNMAYLDLVLKETLRLYPSVPFIARRLHEDAPIRNGTYILPNSALVNMHIYDMHRKEEYYPNPEKFDPDRFLTENSKTRHPYAYIPFSAGPRNCIGQRFAMLEMKSLISTVLRHYELDPVDTPEDVKINADLVLRPKNGVHIKFKPRT